MADQDCPTPKACREHCCHGACLAVGRHQRNPVAESCTWYQDGDSESSVYATSCHNYFHLTDGTPADNDMRWCCYCGKKLVQELITEDCNG